MNEGYPDDWPVCPSCGRPALDGHITCGRAECDEGKQRDLQQQREWSPTVDYGF